MLQSAALGKEEQRILAMKARAEARTHRFLNARSRTIGIDVNGLNAQIAEKKQMKEAQRQADADQCKFFNVRATAGMTLVAGSVEQFVS